MKGKKIITLLAVMCVAMALAVTNVAVAFAADYNTETSYETEQLLVESGLFDYLDGQSELTGGRKIVYRLTETEGVTVTAGQAEYLPDSEETVAGSTVTFTFTGKYSFNVYSGDELTLENSFEIEVVGGAATPTRIYGVTYTLESLLSQFGLEKVEASNASLRTGRKIEYRISATLDGTAIAEGDENYKESSFKTIDNNEVIFARDGMYSFRIYLTNAEGDEDDAIEGEYTVKVVKEVSGKTDYNATSVAYKANLTDYLQAVAEEAQDKQTGDSFNVPSLEKYVYTEPYEYSMLSKIVYYCGPNSESFTQGSAVTTTSPSFSLNAPGKYSFYVLFTDPANNKMTVEGLSYLPGTKGFYETDDDGNAIGNLVVPVFTFEVSSNAAPVVTVKASENAYVGLSYDANRFNVTTENCTKQYKLYYSEKYFDKDDSAYSSVQEYIAAVLADPTTKEVTDDLFNASNQTFTPDKTGNYYVWLKATDEYNLSTTSMSRAIRCYGVKETVQRESEFFKNNVVSIVFLGIALLCLIGIILLLVIKPKQPVTVETETEQKENK